MLALDQSSEEHSISLKMGQLNDSLNEIKLNSDLNFIGRGKQILEDMVF